MIISGLSYQQNYLNEAEQVELLSSIDKQSWLTDLKRRVQHYGYRYDYTHRNLDRSMYLGLLPHWLTPLAERLYHEGIMAEIPNQIIINEYQPGQGISAHIDCIPCFGNTIVSISLLSSCVMVFRHATTSEQISTLITPRSILVMQHEARYAWKHAIMPRKVDIIEGQRIIRQRRVSLTFRTVLNTV